MNARGGKTASRRVAELFLAIMLLSAFGSQLFIAIGAEAIFNATFGGANQDVARSVQQTSDGGYIVAGWTMSFGAGLADFWLIKTSSSGTEQWNRTYGGPGKDEAYCVQLASDGGCIMAGSTESFGAGLSDCWLIKTDANGVMQWNKKYGGVNADYAFHVQQTSDGGYIVAGSTDSFGAGSSDFWLVRTDASGTLLWNKTFGGIGADRAFSVFQTSDGGYFLAGETSSFGAGGLDFWLVRTDSAGNLLWSRTFGGTGSDVARSAQETSDGGYVIAGWTNSFGAGGADFWLVKTDVSGYLQWNRTFGEEYDEEAYAVRLTSDSGYVIAGGLTSPYSLGGWDFWQVKTDANGNRQWDQANGGTADDKAYSVQQTSDGGYILAGSTESYGAGLADFWLTKNVSPPPRPPEEDHDVAIMGVLPSRLIVGEGNTLSVNVTVANLGRYQETTMVSLYANEILIDACPTLLEEGQSEILDFIWNTSGFAKGNYTIKGIADPVLEEAESARANNVFTDGQVVVTIVGDVQGDLQVDVLDALHLGRAYASNPSTPNWNLYCDFNNDNKVDSVDLLLLSQNFGKTSG